MSYNGSGSFLINTAGQPVVSGTVISSTAFNALTADLATGLSTCITKDGQTTVTANIPMANYKFTGLGAGSAAGDSANLSQVQSTVVKLLASVSGTDTITAVGSPTVAAYAAGQMFYFVAAGDNTGAVTINIDSLGAKAVTRDGSVALAAGDIKSGEVVVIVYDGTRFQVVSQLNSSGDARFANVSIASALNVGGVATITGTVTGSKFVPTGNVVTGNGMYLPTTNTLAFSTDGTERLRIDSSGNAGLGVTPSAWSGATGLQVQRGSMYATGNLSALGANTYLADAGANDRYIATSTATKYIQNISGDHRWYVAASGTAGNTITFTQAMTLTADGDFVVGDTAVPSSAYRAYFVKNQAAASTLGVRNTNSAGSSRFTLGNDAGVARLSIGYTGSTASAPFGASLAYFGTEGNEPLLIQTNGIERARITSDGNLGVGTASPGGKIEVVSTNATTALFKDSARYALVIIQSGGSNQSSYLDFKPSGTGNGVLQVNGSDKAVITSGGDFLVGKTSGSGSTAGAEMRPNGLGVFVRDGSDCIYVNRLTNDGDLVTFAQANNVEGTISVSGATVSYNAFAGSHWSQLQDGSKPDILRGTVMESINELCVWPGEVNERLPKSKISDTASSKKVYGVFMAWDNDWTATNDMYVTAVGAFICRVNGSVTVQEGDLLESNGDGTARVQADDIIRSSTIGKVTSTVKTHEYDDGSYCVPTVLYCG